jgi:hypothetical protein
MSTETLSASFLNLDIFYQDIPVFDFFLRERKYAGKKCTDIIYKKALAWESQTTWGVRVHQLDSCDKDITLQKIPKYHFVYATAERSSGA